MFVFVIYDIFTFEVWEAFTNENECIKSYVEKYDGFTNIDWVALNIEVYLQWVKHSLEI